MELKTQSGVELHPSTKTFKGFENRIKAHEVAEEDKSYVFSIFRKELNKVNNQFEDVFYGYAVPK